MVPTGESTLSRALIGGASPTVRLQRSNFLRTLSVAIAVAATVAVSRGQVAVEPITLETAAGVARGFVATVALDDPRVEIVVTGSLPPSPNEPASAEARLVPTDRWAEAVDAVLAVNANFFGRVAAPEAGSGLANQPPAVWADIIGLSISGGVVVSPPRLFAGKPDPALIVTRDGVGRIEAVAAAPVDGSVVAAVAGVGPSDQDPNLGERLVTAGGNTGARARVAPMVRHPRTAVGVSEDGKVMTIITIDGRQPNWSVGVTLPELADAMIARGVHEAINLDGGGSTSFVYFPDGVAGERGDSSRRVVNRPSDGSFRPVANHLGIRVKGATRKSGGPDGVLPQGGNGRAPMDPARKPAATGR